MRGQGDAAAARLQAYAASLPEALLDAAAAYLPQIDTGAARAQLESAAARRRELAARLEALNASLEAYNRAVGSLERNVLPGARKFVELGVRTEKTIDVLEPVEVTARRLRRVAARDLTILPPKPAPEDAR